jgi:hypothetical protein
MEMPALEEDERPWWVKEHDLQNTACHPDDPEDAPGFHVLQASSYARPSRWLCQGRRVVSTGQRQRCRPHNGRRRGEEGVLGRGGSMATAVVFYIFS